jgi:hypothetical protein
MFADTYGATSRLAEQTGLIKPRLKISNQLLGADASYSNFTVNYSPGIFDESAVSLVKASAHELTHHEQNQLQLFLKADQMGIGTQASPEQIQTIAAWFKGLNTGTSPESIARGLTVRAGRHLTDEAAERAHATI